MFTDEHLYSLALRHCAHIGDMAFDTLVRSAGSARAVWNLPKKELATIFGIGSKRVSEIGSKKPLQFAEKEIAFCEKNSIKILLRHQQDYSKLLLQADDAPAILYLKGKLSTERKPISIVGTRNITAYGKRFLQEFFERLPASRITTVSGLALGVDSAVHEYSLNKDIPTVAVLAHGLHTIYPSQNRKLASKILENSGALISEFNSTEKPDREHFIQRNRIIAALSEATLVIETAFGGGSISTVTFANSYNREVFALPGAIHDKYSQGCNQLISQLKARIISTIPDLIDELDLGEKLPSMEQLFPKSEIKVALNDFQQAIVTLLENRSLLALDEMSEITSTPSHKLLSVLLELELQGLVKCNSGRQYSLTNI